MGLLRAAAEAVEFEVRDLPMAGNKPQEAPLRASVLIVEAPTRLCIVSCDTLGLMGDTCKRIAAEISRHCAVPVAHTLVCATHTHHAPRAMPVYMTPRDDTLCDRIVQASVAAACRASERLETTRGNAGDTCLAEMAFCLGQEATVGANSRWLMDDGQISWSQHDESKMVRPTGPHDPDLPVLVFRRTDGTLIGGVFLHGTHNIGTLAQEPLSVISPGFFGLAAQELERQHGVPFLFLPGAFGSSHRRNSHVGGAEAFTRVLNAVNSALGDLRPMPTSPINARTCSHTFRYRQFSEEAEAAAVSAWCRRWFAEAAAANLEKTYATVRKSLEHQAGKTFSAPVQLIRLGDIVLTGIPGELFANLGLRLRHRSPFRHTFVAGLANDEIGYIADQEAYRAGGYQTWFCGHSRLEPGEGEKLVGTILDMLREAAETNPV